MARTTFKNKIAIITGSSQGIGKATAMELVKRGCHVVLTGRNQERLAETEKELIEMGGQVLSVAGDLTVETDALNVVNETIAKFGRLDILVNNAGMSMRGDFAELTPDVYRKVFDINVIGVTNITIPAMPYLKESKGSIVFVSSLAGIRGLPGLSAYCASKMSLRAIAESIRIEEKKSGLHVGLIYVGFTEIEFNKQVISADGSLSTIGDRSKFKAQTKESVALAIANNIQRRNFVKVLTGIGKLNSFMQALAPGVVERVLINSIERIKKRSH